MYCCYCCCCCDTSTLTDVDKLRTAQALLSSKTRLDSAMMSAASPRKKRQRLPSLLIKGVATAVAVAIWLPSAEGFGLSACGASSACAGVRSTSDGAVFSRGWSDSLGMERCCGQEGDRARKERERGGGGGTEGRRRGAHTITCKVASPRKYGSAVGDNASTSILISVSIGYC